VSAPSSSASTTELARIVATGPVFPPAEEVLGEIAVAQEASEASLLPLVRDAEALIARGNATVSARLIDAAPALRVIGRTGVGVEQIDVDAATRRGIPIVIAPDAGAQAVAEGALALMLSLAKDLTALDRAVREGRWGARDEVDVWDIGGTTVGIVGLGRIGRRVAALVEAFGARVLAYDPYAGATDGTELVELDTLFGESDYISLHAPLTAETRGLVDARLLSLARGAVLVNLGRGGLISSLDDLLAALESGALCGVGLDVFDPEPPDPDHPLFRHPRVLLSPHALGLSRQARHQLFTEVAEGIAAVLRGDRPRAVANPEIYA
jgi:D-3-phosphoglycerate dehydrogenase / 2-oxoglutarate reductase